MSMKNVPHGIGPQLCHEKVRRPKVVLKLQILKKYIKQMLKNSKNYLSYLLNFMAHSTNLTQLEYFCSKRESMAVKQLKF